jgi:hypothetical protein
VTLNYAASSARAGRASITYNLGAVSEQEEAARVRDAKSNRVALVRAVSKELSSQLDLFESRLGRMQTWNVRFQAPPRPSLTPQPSIKWRACKLQPRMGVWLTLHGWLRAAEGEGDVWRRPLHLRGLRKPGERRARQGDPHDALGLGSVGGGRAKGERRRLLRPAAVRERPRNQLHLVADSKAALLPREQVPEGTRYRYVVMRDTKNQAAKDTPTPDDHEARTVRSSFVPHRLVAAHSPRCIFRDLDLSVRVGGRELPRWNAAGSVRRAGGARQSGPRFRRRRTGTISNRTWSRAR